MVDFRTDSKAADRSLSWNLGPTGLRGCLNAPPGPAERFSGESRLFFLHSQLTTTSRQILVIDVGPKTPADGVMQVDDVILGTGGKLFDSDARQSLGRAITEAEKETNNGVLPLTVWRKGQTLELQLKLKVMGTYSATAPYDCPKSKMILADACKVLEKEHFVEGRGGFGCVNGLALLATGNPEYLPKVREYARSLAPQNLHLEGCSAWMFGYNNVFLCEYYLLTGDKEVLHGIREHTLVLARGQSLFGTFGHGGAVRGADNKPGSIPWYGALNNAGLIANIGIVMGKKCGVDDPEVDAAIGRASKFFAYFVNKGSIPYGEHEPEQIHDNNGKSALAAVMFSLRGNRLAEAQYFAKMSTAGYLNREVGHTGQGFSYLWTALGANVGGPAATAAFFKESAWHFDLVRRCDGDFTYDGGEQCGPGQKSGADNTYFGKACYAGISPAAMYVLTYSLPLKKLYITGRDLIPDTWLSQKDVAEAMASGRFQLERTKKSPQELVVALGDWSPVVRGWAADELALRPEGKAMVSELITLAEGKDANVRQGACQALGSLKDARALPVLVSRLSDPDIWARAKAAKAIKNFGASASSHVSQMLTAMAVNAKPQEPINSEDPLQFSNGFLAATLFEGPLCDVSSKAPKNLLYPAATAGMELPAGMWRAKVGELVKERLTLEDVQALAPQLFSMIRQESPADRMFSVIAPGDGMRALAKYHVREGIRLALGNVNGMGWLRDAALEVLPKYGDEARWTLPRLQQLLMRWDPKSDEYRRLVNCINTIRNATSAPALVSALPAAQAPDAASQKALTRVGAKGTGLKAEYFSNGKLKVTRIDPLMDFDWGDKAPEASMTPTNFAVRWTGQVQAPETGTYIFSALNADGVRLWINNIQVINDFRDRPLRWTDGAAVNLVEGQRYDLRLVCYKTTGPAKMRLKWSGPSFAGENGVTVGKEWLYPVVNPNATTATRAQNVTTAKDTPKLIVLSTGEASLEPLTYTVATPPIHGSLAGAGPTLTYTPTANYTGTDRFTYRVTRGKASLDPETVGILVTPKITPVQSNGVEVAESGAGTVVVGTGQKISDGNQLTGSIVLMKGGTLSCGLSDNKTLVLATGTTSSIDLPAALGKAEIFSKITGWGSLVLTGAASWYGFASDASDCTGTIKVSLAKESTLRIGNSKSFGVGPLIIAGANGAGVRVALIGDNNNAELPNEIRLESDLVYAQSAGGVALTLRGNISGPGSLLKPFAAGDRGTHLQLRGLNSTYSGGTIFKSGYLDVLGAGALGSGTLTLGGKASPEHVVAFVNISPLTLPNNVVLAGISEGTTSKPAALSEFLVNQDLELSGQVSGTGGLLKTGSGQLTLSGVNTWMGPTQIQAGVLVCNGAASLGQGALMIADKAKLQLDYKGTRRLASLTINDKPLPAGTYGSADSPATTKDTIHFAGTGVVVVGGNKR